MPATAAPPMSLPRATPRWQPQKMTWWYWSLMDRMIAEPEKDLKEFAKDFRVSPAAIYLITGSDLFKAHLSQRRDELRNRIDNGIAQKLGEVALKSLNVVGEILAKKGDAVGLLPAADIMDKTLGRLGYGAKVGPSVAVQVNAPQTVVVPVSQADLEEARQALRRSEAAKLIEASAPAVGPSSRPDQEVLLPGERE